MLLARRVPLASSYANIVSAGQLAFRHVNEKRRNHHLANDASSPYAAVVAGAGPAGLAVVGNLLDRQMPGKVLWVDPAFKAGLLGTEWREVPSNTKVDLFLAFAEAVKPFRDIIETWPNPNAITALRDLPRDQGCSISKAADMVDMLTAGLRGRSQVEFLQGSVSAANWGETSSAWTVESKIDCSQSTLVRTVSTNRLILCTGSYPNDYRVPTPGLQIQSIDLYRALKPSELQHSIPTVSDATVAVIGSSHSAILCLLNLFNLSRSTHPRLRVKWFTRSALQYAVPKDGWILRDNTGLKGIAADFARENLEDDKLPTSEAGEIITRYDCSPEIEYEVYDTQLRSCQYIIPATGFSLNTTPKLSHNSKPIVGLKLNSETGALLDEKGTSIPRAYGAGIAFPERVVDPEGNVEHAVGLWKFMRYLKRVSGQWVA